MIMFGLPITLLLSLFSKFYRRSEKSVSVVYDPNQL
ncbi:MULTISPECIES: hypothetical protein [Parabacteroides]